MGRGTEEGGEPRARRGACPVGRLPPLPIAFFSAPYPPTPFPGGEGGDFYFISPGATAPGTPAAEPGRQNAVLAGGLVSWLPDLLAVSIFFCPHPPVPLPRWGRGRPKLFHARGFAPCIPGAGWGAALGKGANHAPGGGRAPYRAGLGGHPGAQRGCLPSLPPAHPAFALLFCPLSPRPPSRREGGDFRLFYARGFAPCIPGA